MRRTAPVAAVIGLGLAVSLSGCFANPLEQITEGIVEGGVEQLIEDQTGVDVDIDGTGASLPDGWPAEVIVPAGTIIFSAASNGTYLATIDSPSVADAESAYQELLASGFTETAALDLGNDSKTYSAENESLTVAYLWGVNDDGTATVQLTVTPKSE